MLPTLSVLKLLHHSWEPIQFNYDRLTSQEQGCITQEEFSAIVKMMVKAGFHVNAGVVLEFPQVDDTSRGCRHATLIMMDGDCGAIQCKNCEKRWQGGSVKENLQVMESKDCNPPWFRAIKEVLGK